MAILSGDALLVYAFEHIARDTKGVSADRVVRVVVELARASGADGLVGGQVVDIQSEDKEVRGVAEAGVGVAGMAWCQLRWPAWQAEQWQRQSSWGISKQAASLHMDAGACGSCQQRKRRARVFTAQGDKGAVCFCMSSQGRSVRAEGTRVLFCPCACVCACAGWPGCAQVHS